MKISGGISEKGIVVGNTYDKYGTKNPLARWIMRGFESQLEELVRRANPSSIHEVGCGEGYWVMRWREQGMSVRGSDFSATAVELARDNARQRGLPAELFQQKSIYDLQPAADSADLVVCCEVLEHLQQPEKALSVLQKLNPDHLIISVPREPLWRLLNLARGKYLCSFGNTPGHLQNWSGRGFIQLVSRYFTVDVVRKPLPWTMLLCGPLEIDA